METAGFTGENQQQQPQRSCPRCNSINTKFCYFNNYSLTQPRYFCKGCRRYWTHGGTLRNVPVGGSSRKTKRPRSSSSAATTAPNSPLPPPEDANSVPPATSITASPAMGPNFFQLHGGVGGGGFLSSLVVGQSMGGWPQTFIGAGSDVNAAAAVSSAQFWTLGGGGAASSARGGGDQRSNPNQWRDFSAVSGDGADDDQ